MAPQLRRLLSLAPLRPAEALGLIVGGAALWGFAVVTTLPQGAPLWIGWLLTVVGALSVARGMIGLAAALGDFLQGLRHPRGWPGDRAPRTAEETAEVLSKRPPGWEYLYFAGTLRVQLDGLAAKYRDHELRYPLVSDDSVTMDDATDYLKRALDDIRGLVPSLTGLFDPAAKERAFGPPGEPGDPDRIHHLAMRMTSGYERLMDWAARLRGVVRPSELDELFESLAQFADRPVEDYREFVVLISEQFDRIPGALASHEPLELSVILTVSLDDATSERFTTELHRVFD